MTELADVDVGRADVDGRVPPVEHPPRQTSSSPTSGASTSTRCRRRRTPTCAGWPHVAHEVLDELGAVGWPKTSGGKGMHIYVRIAPGVGLRGRPPGRAGVRPRGGAPSARLVTTDVVAQGPRPGDALRRLEPEHPRPHDRGAPTRCGACPRRRCRRRSGGTRSTTRARRLHDRDRAGAVRRARRPARRHRRRRVRPRRSCSSGPTGTPRRGRVRPPRRSRRTSTPDRGPASRDVRRRGSAGFARVQTSWCTNHRTQHTIPCVEWAVRTPGRGDSRD